VLTLVDGSGCQAGRTGTGADGSYEMRAAGPGRYTLIAIAPAHQPQAVEVRADGRPVRTNLVLATVAAQVEGVARTAAGAVVPDARVMVVDADGRTVAATTTGPDGRYSVPGVPLGHYTVIASGYPPAASTLRVEAGRPVSHDVQFDPLPAP
jgi:hypothetical protein